MTLSELAMMDTDFPLPMRRRSIEDRIERLIELLDIVDDDDDREPDVEEPSLGWPNDRQGVGPEGIDCTHPFDCEHDVADDEPSLGFVGNGSGHRRGENNRDLEEGDDNGIADGDGIADQWPSWRGWTA